MEGTLGTFLSVGCHLIHVQTAGAYLSSLSVSQTHFQLELNFSRVSPCQRFSSYLLKTPFNTSTLLFADDVFLLGSLGHEPQLSLQQFAVQ